MSHLKTANVLDEVAEEPVENESPEKEPIDK